MSAAVMMERIAEASPRFKARIAGVLYLLSALTAAFTELFVRGRLNIAGGLIAVSVMVAATLLLYDIFKPVNRGLSLLAAFFNLVGLAFEALRLQPQGLNIAVVFNGFYCLLIGYLIFRSTFLPRF
jgi:tryptophan-rich sensory protein